MIARGTILSRAAAARIVCVWLVAAAAGSCSDDPVGPAAVRIRFVAQPAPIIAGAPLTVAVEFLDGDGLRMTGVRERVSLSTTGNTGSESWTERAVQGVATFADIALETAGSARTLRATAGALTVVSLPFTVAASGASAEHSSFAVEGDAFVSNTPYTIVVTLRDGFANGLPHVPVTLSAPGASFSPASGTTSVDGAFTTLVRAAPGTLVLSAAVNGATIGFAQELAIADACAPTPMTVPGTASGSLLQGAGCVVQGRPVAIRTFTVAAAGGVTIDVRPTFDAAYEIRPAPDQPRLEFITDDSSSTEWFLLPGTYQLRVGAAAGSGTYTVAATTGPGTGGHDPKVLVSAGTYTGQSLTTADLFDGLWYSDYFVIADPRPCTITLRSTAFDAFLMLFDAFTGSGIENKDDGAGGTDAQIIRASCLTIPSQIPIIISATTALPGEVGPYTLTIEFQTPPPGLPDPPASR